MSAPPARSVVSGRDDAEEALRASEHRYRSLVEQSSDGIYLFSPATHEVQEANARFLELMGYTADEIVGRRIEDFIAAPEEGVDQNVSRVVAKGRAFLGLRPYRRKDGTVLDVEVSASLVGFGAESVVLVNVRDVTEIRKASEALSRVTRQHELILESAGEGILGLDAEGVQTFVNPAAARLLGYEPEDLVGRPSHALWHHTRRDGTPYKSSECPIYAAFRDGQVHRVQRDVFWRRDGTSLLVEYVSTPIHEDGHLAGAVVVFRDISTEARLESIAEAVETMNSLGYVFSAVRHELGNPVNSVKMALSVLAKNLDRLSPAAVKEYLERSLGELGRVEELLVSLRSFSLYEDVRVGSVRLLPFLDEFASLARHDFEGRGVRVTAEPCSEGVAVMADPRALRQVLLNLVANAADALEGCDQPAIVLRAVPRRSLVCLEVEDNGRGMDGEAARNLFKPFYTTKASGTGLGLVIVKRMMSRMEGTVDVTSAPGHGTKVVLTLRAAIDSPT